MGLHWESNLRHFGYGMTLQLTKSHRPGHRAFEPYFEGTVEALEKQCRGLNNATAAEQRHTQAPLMCQREGWLAVPRQGQTAAREGQLEISLKEDSTGEFCLFLEEGDQNTEGPRSMTEEGRGAGRFEESDPFWGCITRVQTEHTAGGTGSPPQPPQSMALPSALRSCARAPTWGKWTHFRASFPNSETLS